MKILIVSDLTGGPGGVYKQFELIEKYLSTDIDLKFVLDTSTKEYVDSLYKLNNVIFTSLSPRKNNVDNINECFSGVLASFNPDLVHVINGSLRSNMVIRKYLIKNKIPFITTESLVDTALDIDEPKLRIIREINKNTPCVIYVSKDSKKVAFDFFGINCPNSQVIYNAPLPCAYKKEVYSGKPYRFFTTARCSCQKGIDIMIKALAEVTDRKVILDIYGDGENRSEYERLSDKLIGDRHCFRILGWQKEIDYKVIARDYDLFLSASRSEGLSYSLLEAASLGMPMICSRAPGNVELIELCRCGLLFHVEDYMELAFIITSFLQDPKQLNTMAIDGKTSFDRIFDVKKNMKKLLDQYLIISNSI